MVGPGGATAMWGLSPDAVTIGKAVAGGLPMGAYGVSAELGEELDAGPEPRTGADAHALDDDMLTRLIRIWLANRGIWEALPGAGPTVPVPATSTDVSRYVEAYSDLLAVLR